MERKRTRLYSRRGDLGETSLLFGPRVGKDHRRIELLGTLDELNAAIGLARTEELHVDVAAVLNRLQFRLFEIGAEVATLTPSKFQIVRVTEVQIKELEDTIDRFDEKLPVVRGNIVPGGSKGAAQLFYARTIARRAERRATDLVRFDPNFSIRVVAWLNRVSDLLYVVARFENFHRNVQEGVATL